MCAVQIGLGVLRPDLEPDVLYLMVNDAVGTYTIPYIQADRRVRVEVEFRAEELAQVRLALKSGDEEAAVKRVTRRRPVAALGPVAPGEYTLEAVGYDREGDELFREVTSRVGIGAVIAAIGDSITEGYYGHEFQRGEHLTAAEFPAESVSGDGRNFPQFAPTTATHRPEVNCFESWMTRLNDRLAASWRQPVFVANEGWGGHSSGQYLRLMRTDAKWQQRMRKLKPSVWLIHLGVNDERASVPPNQLEANLEETVGELTGAYGATPAQILVAKPCYDYFEGAEPILWAYCERIDALVERLGLSHGPDFFEAYGTERVRWYGADPVHPNVAGVQRMAALWHGALMEAFGEGGPPP